MKTFLMLFAVLLAGTAIAEPEPEVRVNRIDAAVAASEETVDAAIERRDPSNLNSSRSNTSGKSQDYNSSRSNISTLREQDENIDRRANAGTKAQDYNSSRSNTTMLREDVTSLSEKLDRRLDTDDDGDGVDASVCRNGVDDDCDSPVDAAPANHNTTRSNRTSP